MRDDMFRLLACLSLFFFLVPVTYIRGPVPQPSDSQYLELERVAFDSQDSSRKRAGRLEFLAGWKMTSDNESFGGISSMLALPEQRFLMLSDAGILIGFSLDTDQDAQRDKAVRPFIAPLPDGPAPPNEYARANWDAESLAHDPDTGQYWVGFEHQHSIWRYGASFARKESANAPDEMQSWPDNGGAEAILRLADNRFLVFSESAPRAQGGYQALLFDGDPALPASRVQKLGYQPPAGYELTDAALIDDQRALMLHRRFTPLEGVSAIVSIARLADFQPGKLATSKAIATLKPPLKVDNMEALAVTREGEDMIVWMASDDNFNLFQESLFFKFRLLEAAQKQKKARSDAQTEKAGETPGFSTLEKD